MKRQRDRNLHVVREQEDPTDRILLLAVAAGVYLLVNLQTYGNVRVTDSYPGGKAANNSYREFAGGVLKYSRDGISYLDQKGEEQWNHSYQRKSVGCRGGQRRQ